MPVGAFSPFIKAKPASSPYTYILTLRVSIGWMQAVAVHPDIPANKNGFI